MKKLLTRLHIFLSHHSWLYALIAGVGIVLFWRGVWHTTDLVHLYMSNSQAVMDHAWWDGPLSFLTGCLILYITRAFVSSFIGNELILSGLRTEKKLTRQTDTDLKVEVTAIADIKDEIATIAHKLEDLDDQVRDHHTK
ncbi:MAG: hypothetical protein KBB91_00830 [Candidatus Pacebacteria bacterium]|nr:hypothetical protein [Candidatus Paceibacterota bacterium]MBP9700951.1 hypothetical protein [Candidatus Paceibacterota bacterium]